MQKKQIGLRIEGHLKDGLDDQAHRSGKPATSILEDYIAKGLARDSGVLVEQNSLPAVREAVREEVGKQIQELYQQLSADLQKSAKRSDDRLTALIVRAARSSNIAQRMLYAFMTKLVTPAYAENAYQDAEKKAGQDLARPDTRPSS